MKDRQKRTAALAAFSILAAASGIWGGAAAGDRENLVGISGYERRFAGQEDAFAQFLQEKAIEAQYQKAEVKEGVVVYSTQTASGCVPVTDSSGEVTWDAGWYVVNGAVSISEPITVNGDVNLILADGCDLNAKKGIAVTTDNSLTIYAQSEGSGKLTATGTAGSAPDSEKNASAGIGGSVTSANSGDITIHGGVIHADGEKDDEWNSAAGIGGGAVTAGDGGGSGKIIIYGGVITANSYGRNSGAGIGGGGSGRGNGGAGSDITIYGGSVTAVSTGSYAGDAGIGGGGGTKNGGAGSNIQISGGMVKATGGEAGAGIGGGSGGGENKSGDGSGITISGGEVTAVGGQYAAGIGGGGGWKNELMGITATVIGGIGNVTVSGGIVNASSPADVSYKGDPIGNGGNANGTAADTVKKTAGIIFENGEGYVYGDVSFTGAYEVPADDMLTIPAGAKLSGSGVLSGGKEFITKRLTEDMISVSGEFTYTGADLSEEIKKQVKVAQTAAICGKQFQVDADGWEFIGVAKGTSDLEYVVTYTYAGTDTVSETITVSKTIKVSPAALTDGMVTLDKAEFIYNGAPQQPNITVSGLAGGNTLKLNQDYKVTYSVDDFIKAGTVTVTVEGIGNYTGAVKKTYTVKKAVLTAEGSATAQGSYGTKLSELSVEGPAVSFAGSEVKGQWKILDDRIPDAGDVGPYPATFIPENGAGNYETLLTNVTLTIKKAQGNLTVSASNIQKVYGDPAFSLGCGTNGDGAISYASDKEDVVTVSLDGTAQIKGAGKAVVTVSLADGKNYTGAAAQTVTVTVAKKAAPEIAGEIRQYIGAKGSGGKTAELDVAGKLPKDCGRTAYTYVSQDTAGILSDVAFDDANGKLSYKVNAGESGSGAVITVTAEMENYESADFTLTIRMVDKIKVEITAEAEEAAYDGGPHKGYRGQIVCDYPVGGYSFAYTGREGTAYDSANPPVDAGSYTVLIQAADDSGDYEGAVTLDFRIAKASVTVRADDKTAKVGEPVPELTYTAFGLVKNDRLILEPTLSSGADMNKAGVYPITASGAKAPDTGNYNPDIIYEDGKLTVSENSAGNGSGANPGGSGGNGGSSGGWQPGGSTGGSSGSTVTVPAQPFIKDSLGRKGWDAIRAEARTAASAQERGTVAIDMNGASVVPGSVFTEISGKDVTLTFDMGGGILWSVNGKDVSPGAVKDTDFSVRMGDGHIPQDVIRNVAGGFTHLELSLAHDGAFGFTAALSIQIAKKEGMYANLFYYNPNRRSLEFICADRISEDGIARLTFIHASEYTVIVSQQPMGGVGDSETPGNAENPPASQEPENSKGQVKSVKLSKTVFTYNGKAAKPSVTAIDAQGKKINSKYYIVAYKNNKKVGRATAVVAFKGGYSGVVKKAFTIRPKGTSIKKVTPKPDGFTVKWTKRSKQANGYQLQYSKDSRFQGNSSRSVWIKKTSVTKRTVKKWKAGKKYYARIRVYKTVKAGGKSVKVYSAWSKVARVKAQDIKL